MIRGQTVRVEIRGRYVRAEFLGRKHSAFYYVLYQGQRWETHWVNIHPADQKAVLSGGPLEQLAEAAE